MKTAINCPECGKKTDIVFYGKIELTICTQDLIWAGIFNCEHCRKDFAAKFSYTPVIEIAKIYFQNIERKNDA